MPNFAEQKRASLKAAANFNRGLGVPDAPLCLYLEVSNLCNLKCAFCPSFSAINPKRLSTLKAEDRGFFDLNKRGNLDELMERALTVYLFGFGEPTIHPDFPELIKYVGKFEAQIEFVSNAMNLTESLSRILVESRVRQVMISFSGSTKSDYESMYLNGDFDRVLSNIKTLSDLKKKAGSPYPIIMINSIALKHHIDRFPDFVDLMGARGVNIINVNNLSMSSAFPEMLHHATVYSPIKHAGLIQEARVRAEKYGIILGIDSFLRDAATTPLQEIEILQNRMAGQMPDSIRKVELHRMQEFASSIKAERPAFESRSPTVIPKTREEAIQTMNLGEVPGTAPIYCMEPFRVAYIRKDGDVMPCCLWPEKKHSFGNIFSMTSSEIWNGPAFEITRSSIVGQKRYPNGCKYCVKSRIAPEDAQLWQAVSFIEWYRQGYGIDLSDSFDAGPLMPAKAIVETFSKADGSAKSPTKSGFLHVASSWLRAAMQ
jgi:MoaA/NifB/PqqE/SkfB family radical SAM enzyme